MSERLGRREQAALVQLADGTLTGAARQRAQARLQAIPDAERLLERQRRVSRALAGGTELRRVETVRAARPSLRFAMAGALAAVLAVLVVMLSLEPRPSVERAAAISQMPATAPAPAGSGPVLRAEVDGVEFPDWGREFGWHATGMRQDEIGDRDTTTVFYEHEGHRLAYTIVSGRPLPQPDEARIVEWNGLRISVYQDPRHGGHEVAVFERGGRTCVVAGHVKHLSTLLELAAWKGGGDVRS